MILWMKRKRLLVADPLVEVRAVPNPNVGGFRRSLSVDEIQRLLAKSPRHRAMVYQTILYTGLRRAEMNGLKWDDFKLMQAQPHVRVPSSLSKNRKESIHHLRPELVDTLTVFRPADAKLEDFVFRGLMIDAVRSDLQGRLSCSWNSLRGCPRPAHRPSRPTQNVWDAARCSPPRAFLPG